jgi:hypothetical protein
MLNEKMINELQKLNNKESYGFHIVIKSSDPIYYLPKPLILSQDKKYEAAIIYYSSDNYFENIDTTNNKFYYSTDKGKTSEEITVRSGYYDVDEYNDEIFRQMKLKGHFKTDGKELKRHINIEGNLNIYRTIIENTHDDYIIDFTRSNTFSSNLGFDKIKLNKGRHISKRRIQITHIKQICVHCDLITGGYNSQGKKTNIILSYPLGEFPPGAIITIRPSIPMFLPVVKYDIDKVEFKITDQNNKVFKSEDEEIAMSIYIRQV